MSDCEGFPSMGAPAASRSFKRLSTVSSQPKSMPMPIRSDQKLYTLEHKWLELYEEFENWKISLFRLAISKPQAQQSCKHPWSQEKKKTTTTSKFYCFVVQIKYQST